MIDKVALLQRAFASLRVAGEPARARAGAPGRGVESDTPTAAQPAPSGGSQSLSLNDLLRRRLLTIDRAAPDLRRRMLRLTLETCFAAEWGQGVAGDPAFHSLVDRVLHQIESDPSLQAVIDDAIEWVSSPAAT